MALAGLKPGDAVLDLGCGTGMLACAFAKAAMSVTAMDPEPAMLNQARSRAQGAGGRSRLWKSLAAALVIAAAVAAVWVAWIGRST